MDILTKELIDTYTYSTANHDRYGAASVKMGGREYLKLGQYQAVTLVGNVFKIYDPNVKLYKRVLYIGVAKQHPCDVTLSKEVAFEVANEKSWSTPNMVIEIGPHFNKNAFLAIAKAYVSTLDLRMVKTAEEVGPTDYYSLYYKDFKKLFCKPSNVQKYGSIKF